MFGFFQKLADPFVADDGDTMPTTAWAFLNTHFRTLRPILIVSFVLTVLGAALEVWMIGYGGTLVDLLAATSPATLWAEHGSELLLAAVLVGFGRPLLGFLYGTLDDVAFRPNAETLLRWRAHRHVLRQPVGWFRQELSGRVASWVLSTGTAGTGAVYSVFHTLVHVGVYIVGSVILMASLDLRLVVPLGLWLAAYVGLMAYVVPRFRRATEAQQEAAAAVSGHLVDTYGNIDTVKLYADPTQELADGRAMFGAALQRVFAVQRLEVAMNSGMQTLGSLLIVGLVGYAIWLWQLGHAQLGLVAVALALSFRITAMGEWLLDAMSNLFGALGALRQGLKTVAQPLQLRDVPNAGALVVTRGAIVFDRVSHHYGRDDGGLDRLSLSIASGEKVGLVGRSGAGKSTLVNLALRFFDPEAGEIRIDDQNIALVSQDSLRSAIAMVTQEAALLHRSVRDNIGYGRSQATDAEIAAAAQLAEANRFIAGLVDQQGRRGYDALVGERGVTLSGGQRQRIALARALLKDAPMLILDEATSALDSEVEAAIQSTLDRLMAGKTVVAIAHRLSTIARMDRIVVLDDGRVAEAGTHAELLARDGIYALLWARQAGGFLGM